MLRVTRLTDYATVVLTVLASDAAAVLSASELAERAGLEVPTVAKVLKPLAQAGLVEGFRGANGWDLYLWGRNLADTQYYELLAAQSGGAGLVVGTLGEAPSCIRLVQDVAEAESIDVPAGARLAYLTQTTLSVDDAEVIIAALRKRFPDIVGPSRDDICYATQNRQEAVKDLVPEADMVIVLGSQNSSNSQRLAEIARALGRPAYLIDRASEIDDAWFAGKKTVLITAGEHYGGERTHCECETVRVRNRHGLGKRGRADDRGDRFR